MSGQTLENPNKLTIVVHIPRKSLEGKMFGKGGKECRQYKEDDNHRKELDNLFEDENFEEKLPNDYKTQFNEPTVVSWGIWGCTEMLWWWQIVEMLKILVIIFRSTYHLIPFLVARWVTLLVGIRRRVVTALAVILIAVVLLVFTLLLVLIIVIVLTPREIMEKYRKMFYISFLVLCLTINDIQCRTILNSTNEIASESRSLDSRAGYRPLIPQDEDNELKYPDEESDFDDYPASYYRDPSKFFTKPGLGGGFGGGFGGGLLPFLPGLGALGFLHSLKWKVGIVTIVKILLKVILIKKIIKFIILIFLLIFTPSLFSIFSGGHGGGNNWLFRKFNYEKSNNEKINDLAMFVLTSIDSYQSAKECGGNEEEYKCRLSRMFKMIDAKYPFQKIFKIYRKKIDAEDRSKASTL